MIDDRFISWNTSTGRTLVHWAFGSDTGCGLDVRPKEGIEVHPATTDMLCGTCARALDVQNRRPSNPL
jgi:hypothetical protein